MGGSVNKPLGGENSFANNPMQASVNGNRMQANPSMFVLGALPGMYDMYTQYQQNKQLAPVKRQYEQDAQSQGMQARQQSIASGTGGGGVQLSSDVNAYNNVMAQYAAIRQAMDTARIAQQMQMYGQFAQLAGFAAGGPAGSAGAGAGMNAYGQATQPTYGGTNRPTRGIGANGVW